MRAVVERLIVAHQWQDGDRNILVVMDAGYGLTRLPHPTPPRTPARSRPAQAL
ncbi:hypothetical protein [Streptomyces diastatochromogenes]|uniref:hypothetical protein n=1 Tax=Streptomyces diastatochromogenes TaxID=42236 RepID=UPI0039BEF18C